ncbi:C4-dicarboxylate ABC transporter [Rhodococcoides trifolii]|uniref:C4-dicarboxylate ABC transporter n=2 Tax=Rhodococcoides trifolii TaxID=908250 RepID=A0A917LHL5_9NOCA|nr:C4-dicarboxylate ABC transporter [Rhodococcus trifolii]
MTTRTENVTPNWFAAIMGTGIVSNAAATLPVHAPGLRAFAVVVWVCAATALAILCCAFAAHWTSHRTNALGHARDPIMVQFYGAPPMALLTVAAGAMLVGPDVVGTTVSGVLFVVLWTLGTAAGLTTAVVVPYLMMTAHDHRQVVALPAWLMPVVPPMVSASTGALLLPHIAEGQWRLTLLALCYAMFGLSLIVGMLTMASIYSRLVHGGVPPVQAAPTVWIALGLVGQSITAANLLPSAAPAGISGGLRMFGIVYGLVMGGFGVFVFALAAAITVHAFRRGLTFSLTWWSFTFPVGTCVTGATALGTALGSTLIHGLAVVLYVALVGAWGTVAVRTVRRSGPRPHALPTTAAINVASSSVA